MPLPSGTRLGPYEIVAAIGAGGMGQVYKARDTRLDRTVAVKVLSDDVASDREFRERFDREARSISALDHPHICTLYDVGEAGGTAYLVMQHLEGETLAQRLDRGPLPIAQVLAYAVQIAGALDQAHRHGLVHRDLKPGNVMLTRSGAVLLDFGLAKAAPPAVSGTASTALAASPKPAAGSPLTAQGTLLGTFQYMAPEQLEGRDVDARADIFAFGAVLYEMIAGRRAFEGQTQASLIAAILEREPPSILTQQPQSPPALDWTIRRALAKAPDDRWQSVRDLAAELSWIAGSLSTPSSVAATAPRSSWMIPALLGIVGGALAAGMLVWRFVPRPAIAPVRAIINVPADATFGAVAPSIAISPDGRRVVFTVMVDDQPTLFLRPIDRFEAEPIRGTAGARGPFFSPDSQQVGFFADGKLKRVVLGGNLPLVICDAPDVRGAAWAPDDTIVFAPSVDSGLVRVPAAGGTPKPVTTRDESKRERTHRYPAVLPSGKTVLFMIGTTDIATYADARIAVQSLDGGTPKVLVEGGSSPKFAAGHLFYSRGNVVMAAPFDESRQQIGDAFPVAEAVAFRSSFGATDYDVAADGTLLYAPGGEAQALSRLVWMDRAGKVSNLDDAPRFYSEVIRSPSAPHLLLWDQGANDALWIRDLRRGTSTRVTHQGNILGGSWTHDARRIIYSLSDRLAWVPVDGTGSEEVLYRNPYVFAPVASADGDSVFFTSFRAETGTDIWRLSLKSRTAESWLSSRFNEGAAQPSPDGKLVAYTSDETGRPEVFVRSITGEGREKASSAGGDAPVWSPDSRELYFLGGDQIFAVTVRASPTIELSAPKRLFKIQQRFFLPLQARRVYDVMPDGRFVFIETQPAPKPTELRLVQAAFSVRTP